ncbi:PEK kinase [Toxoplasma gondii p89]|uniref:PEK kinase n=1 Tax=Toxoplasma gondii p89 TaxID=943119 RepID=A0A086J7C1_TOXGO|nr:PEK kinase [Toxoplasma gondii p89]
MLASKCGGTGGGQEVVSSSFLMSKPSFSTLPAASSPANVERKGQAEPSSTWLGAESTKTEVGKTGGAGFVWGLSGGGETAEFPGGCRLQAADGSNRAESQHFLPSQGGGQGPCRKADLGARGQVKRGDQAARARADGDGCRVSPKGENVDANCGNSGRNPSSLLVSKGGPEVGCGPSAPHKMDKVSGSSCASAVNSDLSLVCPLHAYRFCLRDFDFGGFLGDGAHGCVFVARERRSGFVCVLKCITKAHLVRGGNEALLKKEVELQAHLKHPHICCMYTWFQTSSAIFLVMEYCLKGDLFALLDKTTFGFDERTVAKQLFQITWAIRTCHDKRIAHLDIKPENVLVDHMDKLKLADFGLSAHIGGEHRKRGVSINRGTCDYFSPEQCTFRLRNAALRAGAKAGAGEAATRQQLIAAGLEIEGDNVCSFDEKSDIWTIGILGFELFFKFPPFGSQCHIDEETVMQNIRNKHWSERVEQEALRDPRVNEKLMSMSDDFKAFLSACLNKKASLRPTAEALLEFPFLQKNNPEVVNSVHFLQQPRHQQGHKGFNQPAGPWQTPRPTCC